MLIIGTFENSIELEQALAVLEHHGISEKQMLVVPMDTDPIVPNQYIGRSRDVYYKSVEVGMAGATLASIFGASAGFALKWGPIFWGLIAAFTGFSTGFGIYFLINRGKHRRLPQKLPEVTVIVQCSEDQSALVKETMWHYRVLTVGQTASPS